MKKTILSTFMATALMTVSTSAMAGQIDGAINADNRFTVAVTQNGNVISRYDAPSNYDWRTTQRFSLKTPDDLKQCKVNVIVWGDNTVAEGFAGVLKGNNGHIYSGGSGAQGFASAAQSTFPSGGTGSLPTTGEVITMAGQSGPAPSVISSPVWGSAGGYYTGSDFSSGSVPTNVAWVKPQGAGTTTDRHWVFSSPCGSIVKKTWVDVPGDHFQCYMLEKGDRVKPEQIVIEDQFGKSEVVLGQPRMLCNPSAKRHRDKLYRVENEKRHLVCYDIVKQGKVEKHELNINNQFGPDDVVSTRRRTFCVPSLKEHIDKAGDIKDTRYERVRPRRPEPRQQRR